MLSRTRPARRAARALSLFTLLLAAGCASVPQATSAASATSATSTPEHAAAPPHHDAATPGHDAAPQHATPAHPGSGHGTPGSHAAPGSHDAPAPHTASPAASGDIDQQLAAVARIHGGTGPWAVAGYRMGQHALARLGLAAQSFDLEVVHHSPRAVQFTCIADGAAAATGASLGKLNLSLVEEPDETAVSTTYRRRSTGTSITLRPTAAFRTRFKNVPREQLPTAGRTAMELPASEIFEEAKP
ncbi:FmdE family protein [Chondromyces apiculatus]|uniref:Formylmethanofuran dehydrogenase subunit E domain-containing protein n=1 Tax=Chondromyces apiculatus DSM 436 TaxID=1192034 RepID=A0A017T0U7_9BACT|nr:FmdE family protein [Chondromyces apiculatus]EYF02853.1 Hypothetical protein CAP_6433 [Chondromyces apiculatus DSM 436]